MREIHLFNKGHYGDCLWTMTYCKMALEANEDCLFFFYCEEKYHSELKIWINPTSKDRMLILSLENNNIDKAWDAWIGSYDFYGSIDRNNQEIQGICYDIFAYRSKQNGIRFPYNKEDFIYEHPDLLKSNRMMDELGAPEIIFVNSTPNSTQFSQDDEELIPLYEYLKGRNVFITKRTTRSAFPCTLDYELSLFEIAQLASRAKIVIGIETGPMSACVHIYSVRSVREWYPLSKAPLHYEYVINRPNARFQVCSDTEQVVNQMKEKKIPRVSVLMSLYRGEKYLEEHLDRFSQQTIFDEVELVICHNDPTPRELEIINSFSRRFPHAVTHIVEPRRTKWSESMNVCAKRASAPILAIGNVDDVRTPTGLQAQVEWLEDNLDYDVVHGHCIITNTFGSMSGRRLPANGNPEALKMGMWLGPFFAWRKDVMDKIGYFDEQFEISADFDFAMRLARSVKIGAIDEDIGCFLEIGEGLSTRGDWKECADRTYIKNRWSIPLQRPDEIEIAKTDKLVRYRKGWTWFGQCYSHWKDEVSSKISVIVSSYNQLRTLKLTIESLTLQEQLPHEVIVADDGSTDGTLDWLDSLEHCPFPVRYITREHNNYGLAGINHLASKQVAGDRILFTNADVLHSPNSVKDHASLNEAQIGGGIIEGISSGVNEIPEDEPLCWIYLRGLMRRMPSKRRNMGYIERCPSDPIGVWGGNFSVSTSLYRLVNGHNAEYEGWGGEDNDVAKRCIFKGAKIKWVYGSVGCHLDHPQKKYAKRQLGSKKYASS